ncbi:ATP-binding cassette domain-containing protein, partial [Ruminiclostridium cellulolyticum]|uniref:ATP-binding cassette domain-containing protein n=1 Tax=Ruminiclostridium cellulolyticum TaxID=1521 RepID=UPI0000E96EAC
MNVIEIKNLTKVIKGQKVIDNVSIDIEGGKTYGFIGYNGSGKSMLFKAICGFVKANEGEIYIFGKRIGKDIDFPEKVGALIEHPGFLPDINGFENLKYLSEIQNIITDKEIKDALAKVGLDQEDKKKVKSYSLGMKQRLGIAQAIMESPEILILDEPLNGLDKEGVESIRNLLLNYKKEGRTILIW